MRLFTTCFLVIATISLQAQYTSPDEGLAIDLEYLVANSAGAVTFDGTDYLISEDITVAASDVLEEDEAVTINVAEEVLITIEGGLELISLGGMTFTWADEDSYYEGFRFEDGSSIHLQNITFEYGGGLRVLTNQFVMEGCAVNFQETIASTGGAIGLSYGKPEIIGCTFISNVSAAINSAANSAVAPIIEDCTFQFNGTSIVNKPQINLGPSGVDTTIIRNNIIEGHSDNTLSGGIGFSSLLGGEGHAVIENNEVFNNRYGVAMIGNNITSLIIGNTIYNNDIEGEPLQGGSGINLFASGSNHAVITENEITGNLWGITLQGTATANLGDTTETNFNPGQNLFEDNGNGGEIYALFNNTENDLMAMNNCWDGLNSITEAEAEAVISHQVDDPSLGLVTYTPLGFCGTVGVGESHEPFLTIFPNPASQQLNIQTEEPIVSVSVWNISGQVIKQQSLNNNTGVIQFHVSDLSPGVYLLRIETSNAVHTERITRR